MIQCSARHLHHTTIYIIVVFSRFSDPKVPFHGRDSEAVTEDSHAWGLNEIYGLELPTNEGIKRCHWLKLLSPSTNALNKIVTFGKFERYPSLSWTSWTSNVAIGITSFKMLLDLMFRLSSHLMWYGSEQILRLVQPSYSQPADKNAQQSKLTQNFGKINFYH